MGTYSVSEIIENRGSKIRMIVSFNNAVPEYYELEHPNLTTEIADSILQQVADNAMANTSDAEPVNLDSGKIVI